jgi:rhodanese-related sulfurtransferase
MRDVTASTLRSWLETGDAEIIDVREPAEFAAGHVPGARSVPLGTLRQADLGGTRKLVLVCASGRRSASGCDAIAATATREVHSLDGGMAAWKAAGGAVAGTGKPVMPLDRQVLIAAGSLVLAGVIGSQLVHPGFIWLSAFVGAGLVFAGTTGFCGMALLLAKAPWNQRPARA